MSNRQPFPLFPVFGMLKSIDINEFPDLRAQFNQQPDFFEQQWQVARQFLLYYGTHKSEHTYTRFRSEIEKYLLWGVLIKDAPVNDCSKLDILEYAEFFYRPPVSWICFENTEKFLQNEGLHRTNTAWRPFRYIINGQNSDIKDASRKEQDSLKKAYRSSRSSMQAMFTAITTFHKYLVEIDQSHPRIVKAATLAKKDCKYLQRDESIRSVKRLDQDQWEYLLKTATIMADSDPGYERNLFLVVALKTMFLRISELSERDSWSPTMSHFSQDRDDNWWLLVYGKGPKLRSVSVPASFLPYLKRYRASRKLVDLPGSDEKEPIISKVRGKGGMTSRQLARLVEDVFKAAMENATEDGDLRTAQVFGSASTHCLRHTGASLEVERGRPLKDLSEDLGHSSMETTDSIYVRTSEKVRAESGRKRPV